MEIQNQIFNMGLSLSDILLEGFEGSKVVLLGTLLQGFIIFTVELSC